MRESKAEEQRFGSCEGLQALTNAFAVEVDLSVHARVKVWLCSAVTVGKEGAARNFRAWSKSDGGLAQSQDSNTTRNSLVDVRA